MMRYVPAVSEYMTPAPKAIGSEESVSAAHELMRRYRIRHLPVMRDGRLAGIISDRDVRLVRGLGGTRAERVLVEEAMSAKPFTVAPDAPLNHAARVMAERRVGSAVVMAGREVIGVLTTTDALNALADALEGKGTRAQYEEAIASRAERRPRRGRGRPRERELS
jgi:acetoin utilization protein AcuB